MKAHAFHISLTMLTAIVANLTALQAPPAEDLPSSINHTELNDGTHRYVVQGIYVTKTLENTLKFAPEYQKDEIPDCLSVKIDTSRGIMSITTSKEIADMPTLFNKLAADGGCLPTWPEICLRDKRSEQFDAELYKVAYNHSFDFDGSYSIIKVTPGKGEISVFGYSRSGDRKTNHAEFALTFSDGEFSLEQIGETERLDWPEHEVMSREPDLEQDVRCDKGAPATLKCTESTAYCTCHSRYAMRIFDGDENSIWEDQPNTYGNIYPIVYDFDEDGVDEIVVFREDHGEEAVLVFKRSEN